MSGNMLSAHFRRIFEDSLTTVQQHQAVDALKDYIAELKDGTDEQRCDLGVLEYDDVAPDVIEHKVQAALDKCYWQLVMFLRFSRPSRIGEAEPYLRILYSKLQTPPTVCAARIQEVSTALYLAAALAAPAFGTTHTPMPAIPRYLARPSARCAPYACASTSKLGAPATDLSRGQPSREAEALELFTRAFALYDASSPALSPQGVSDVAAAGVPRAKVLGPKTELWARAAYAALLRRQNREADAADVVQLIRSYVTSHPFALPSEKYHRLLKGIEHEFGIVLLDLTLSLETENALGLTVGGGRPEIEHVEDVESTQDVTESEPESDNQASDAGSEIPEDMVSSTEYSSYAPSSADSSDSESSSESSFMHSPVTPSLSQFPNTIVHNHPAVIESFTARRGVFSQLKRTDSDESSSSSDSALDEPLSKLRITDGADTRRPNVVRYGAM
ncbi:hypothetical protein EIP86_008291 [Pleurotus ostreatoroseus]|nr:hypothetical protein EIP86_008291 [Pleurotus ostreatoroseus]